MAIQCQAEFDSAILSLLVPSSNVTTTPLNTSLPFLPRNLGKDKEGDSSEKMRRFPIKPSVLLKAPVIYTTQGKALLYGVKTILRNYKASFSVVSRQKSPFSLRGMSSSTVTHAQTTF